MACPCGGPSLKAGSASLKVQGRGECHLELFYASCKACERVGMERLYRDGDAVIDGPIARQVFQKLVAAEPAELPDLIATSLKEQPRRDPEALGAPSVSEPETDQPCYDQLELL